MTRLASTRRIAAALVSASLAAPLLAARGDDPVGPRIPLCPGLTIVTAVNQRDGDYESIKTIQSVTDSEVRMRYSTERTVQDVFSTEGPKLQRYTIARTMRQRDLASATLYLQQFSTELPELIPETTAIGTSAAVLNALKSKGRSTFGFFITFTQHQPSIDRNVHPNVYDNQMVGTITRMDATTLPVIVNDVPAVLPVVRAGGEFFGDKAEFFFLDDAANPLTLKFSIGVGAIKPLSADAMKVCAASGGLVAPANSRCDMPNGGDRDTLRVIKITSRCDGPGAPPAGTLGGAGTGRAPGGGAAAGQGGADALERVLANSGRVDIYSIYFSFNSDVIRDESEPTLKDIAEVLRRHPDWHLAVNGHTDGIGGDQFNLDLSRRRAAAVKDALHKRYGIDGARLSTAGFGKSQPRDTNDTLEGRAHNRRVELVRQS